MTTAKQANQRARYAALAAAQKWLAKRMKQPRQCDCEQCQMVLRRQAVCNVVNARNADAQRTLFDALGV